MRLLSIILSIVLFASCMTPQRLAKKTKKACDFCSIMSDSTTTTDTTIVQYKDTAIYITRPGRTILLDNPCATLCDSFGNLIPFIKTERKNGLVTTIEVVDGDIVFDCQTDSMKVIIDDLRHELRIIRTTVKPKVIVVEPTFFEKLLDKFKGFLFWYFWITVITGSILLGKKFKLF